MLLLLTLFQTAKVYKNLFIRKYILHLSYPFYTERQHCSAKQTTIFCQNQQGSLPMHPCPTCVYLSSSYSHATTSLLNGRRITVPDFLTSIPTWSCTASDGPMITQSYCLSTIPRVTRMLSDRLTPRQWQGTPRYYSFHTYRDHDEKPQSPYRQSHLSTLTPRDYRNKQHLLPMQVTEAERPSYSALRAMTGQICYYTNRTPNLPQKPSPPQIKWQNPCTWPRHP